MDLNIDYSGKIRFIGCDDLCISHRFRRVNIKKDSSNNDNSLLSIVHKVYKLTEKEWEIPKPKLIISVIGGFKRMDISNQQKKNFKQGLIDVMKTDQTVIIAGGFNVGVHKLVSDTVREFRIHYENNNNHVHLIGICTWGVVWNNERLRSEKENGVTDNVFLYPNTTPNEKGKVSLDPNYDSFLFCDDGTEKQYDKEVDFRLQFEMYSTKEASAFAVQILCEGGYRAIYRAHETLKNKISIVVLKGSGRAADLISEVMELGIINLEKNIFGILDHYKAAFNVKEDEIERLKDSLMDMYEKYLKQIIIYNMFNSTKKFGQSIVEAIIAGQAGRNLEDTLDLTIRFNCVDIALKEVFYHADYSKIDVEYLKKCFLRILRENKYEFLILFLENNIEIANIINQEMLIELYENSPYAELLNDFIIIKHKKNYSLHLIAELISILSGNILQNFYTPDKEFYEKTIDFQDLFIWSLLSCKIELSEIFWRFGKDHVSSALIASTILKKMAFYTLKRGDSELEKKLKEAASTFEALAIDVLTKAYFENKKRTYTILIREIKSWNNMTCLSIALSGNLLEFLSHSACRSYTTQVWMGELSPFLSLWKILLTIPFSPCFIHCLIMPSFYQNRSKRKATTSTIKNYDYTDCSSPLKENYEDLKIIKFSKALKIFYSAPIVKFYINFGFYLLFLTIFAYLNLVELKPRSLVNHSKDVAAEIFVYFYLFTFIIEEVRQIYDQPRIGFNKKLHAYFNGSCNQFDTSIIFIFLGSILVRFCLPDHLFMICRSLYSICYCMFCIRTMQFYFAYEFIGPKVIMIYHMVHDIVFFLCIFAIFIISFGTLSHSLTYPNSEMDIFLIKNVIQTPYFQAYGESTLDKIISENFCNNSNCYIQQSTVTLSYSIYLLLTTILLINLLIAMFGYTFNQIQDQSVKYWLFLRLQLVEEFYTKPILSPPLNIFYFCYILIIFIKSHYFKKEEEKKKRCTHGDNLLLKILPGNENLRIAGFEQICMESSIDDMQALLNDFVAKNNVQSYERRKSLIKTLIRNDL